MDRYRPEPWQEPKNCMKVDNENGWFVLYKDHMEALKRRDDPESDGTDYAHPAWHRAHTTSVTSVCSLINEILDGKPIHGVCAEPWESTRTRIADMKRENEELYNALKHITKSAKAMGMNEKACLILYGAEQALKHYEERR